MMMNMSLKTQADYIMNPYSIPEVFQWSNYKTAIEAMNYWRALLTRYILPEYQRLCVLFYVQRPHMVLHVRSREEAIWLII